jgi:hypothetical protein
MLPRSHTCFSQLVLPIYESEGVMRERMEESLVNCRADPGYIEFVE